jgi:hypothetical protein
MLNFSNPNEFVPIHHFKIPTVYTWGNEYRDKREAIRKIAVKDFPNKPHKYNWYGFTIKVKRNRFERRLDIENIPKLIIDAFSSKIIDADKSQYPNIKLYPDDDLEYVRAVQIEGTFSDDGRNETEVWILGKI